jgi:hypothetical protein
MYDTLALGISWRIGHLNFFEMFRFCIFFLYLKMYIFKYILHTQWYNNNNSTCTQIHIMTTCMFSYLMHIGQNISVFEVRLEHTCVRMNWELLTNMLYLTASVRHNNVKSLRIQRHQCIQKQYFYCIIKIGFVLSCCMLYNHLYICRELWIEIIHRTSIKLKRRKQIK